MTVTHKTPFPPLFNLKIQVSLLQVGQANLVRVFHPDKVSSPRRSLIIHAKVSFIVNISFFDESNVFTQSYHISFNSLMRGCRYKSILFPGACFPGMIMKRIIDVFFMLSQEGRLYGIRTTGQML